jgi:hypothetical protein
MIVALIFVTAVAFVTVLKVRNAYSVMRWIWDPADPSLRKLLVFSVIPGVAAAGWLAIEGLYPPAAVALGALLMMGILSTTSGVLAIEGALLEPESAALIRRESRTPPPSSFTGRVVAILIGAVLTSASASLLAWLR